MPGDFVGRKLVPSLVSFFPSQAGFSVNLRTPALGIAFANYPSDILSRKDGALFRWHDAYWYC